MGQKYYQIPDTTIFRKVENELVVIQLDTGKFYYFNEDTEALLNHLKIARAADELIEENSPNYNKLSAVFEFLLKENIVSVVERPTQVQESTEVTSFGNPAFLREGDKRLDEITFLCP